MTNTYYLYDSDANKAYFNKNRFVDKQLGFSVIERGTILPFKRPAKMRLSNWWGLGGVFDEQRNFVENSFPTTTNFDDYPLKSNIKKSSKTAVYLGLFAPVWGHVLTINLKHMWFLQSDVFKREFKDCSLVYLPWAGRPVTGDKSKNFRRILEILGIDVDALKPITKPTQFEKVILPDESFFVDGYRKYASEYVKVIDRMRDFALKNRTPVSSKKIFYFYGRHQVGEERLAEYFKSKGYEIISPEKLTVDEQLNVLINCESFASTLGSCSHNSIFLPDGAEVIIIPRAILLAGYQQVIDDMHNVRAHYVDSSMSLFGGEHGPNCFIISKQLKSFFGDAFDGYDTDDFKIFLQYVKDALGNDLKLHRKAKMHYGKIFPDFMAQLNKHPKLIASCEMPTDWRKKLL